VSEKYASFNVRYPFSESLHFVLMIKTKIEDS
jgi:hypothetical protein